MKRLFVAALVGGLLLPVAAEAQRVGLAGRVGVFGIGGEASAALNRFLGVRGGVGSFFVQPSGTIDQADYTIKPPSAMANVGVDVYPLGGKCRLSGGLLLKHDINLDASPRDSIEFNDHWYTPQEAGKVTGLISWSSTAPYATMGWSGRGKGFGMFFDFGAAFLGEPKFTFAATNAAANQALQGDLAAAEDSARVKAGKYMKILPVINFGFRIGI